MSAVKIDESWGNVLNNYFKTQGFIELTNFIKQEYQTKIIYPIPQNIFNAFDSTPFDKVKVVILGQDPYHNPDQAHGLSFSVQNGIKLPPSLQNIYKEIQTDLGIQKDFKNGNLINWAEQGILLLNSVLTVEKNQPGSHAKKGWEEFTNEVIIQLSNKKENLVFLLWGNYAKQKGKIIDRSKHLVLEANHPSPFSAHKGFFGCKHFSQTNQYLKDKKTTPVEW